MADKWGQAVAERGFAQIPNYLLLLNSFIDEKQRLTPVELLVVFQLVGAWWQRDSMPFPSMATLAKRLGVSERQVQRAIARLVKSNIIAKTKRKSKGMISPNAYDLSPLVELLGSIAKAYPNEYPRKIKRGRLKASATPRDFPEPDASDLPIKGFVPAKGMEAPKSTRREQALSNGASLIRGSDMSWFKPYEF